MKSKPRTIILILSILSLCSCIPKVSTTTSIPEATPTIPPPWIAPTPTSLPRWRQYELALSQAVLKSDTGLCEWEIWGQSGKEVYVWAFCLDTQGIGPAAGTGPAVIYLGENGQIEKVTIPRDGVVYGKDIQSLFPPEVRTKVYVGYEYFDGRAAEKHIEERRFSLAPPWIATSGIVLP